MFGSNITLVGNITSDAEYNTTDNYQLTKFSVAVNYGKYKDKDDVCFVDCTLWGKLGESLTQYLTKGKQVIINGELKQNSWVSDDGQNKHKLYVNVKDVKLVSQNKNSDQSNVSYEIKKAFEGEEIKSKPDDLSPF